MKTSINLLKMLTVFTLLITFSANAQKTNTNTSTNTKTQTTMKTYVIEREIPGAGELTPAQLKEISQKSCGVLKELGTDIEWLHSYVTGNKL